MFKWFKKLFGSEEQPASTTDDYQVTVEPEAAVQEPALRPAPQPPMQPASTVSELKKLTKVQIEELAKNELGVDLDRRKTKDRMIQDFIDAQKNK